MRDQHNILVPEIEFNNLRAYVRNHYDVVPLKGPLGLHVTSYRQKTENSSKDYADSKPHTTEYIKQVRQALKDILWVNGAHIVDEHCVKYFTDGIPRVEIKVWKMK